MHTFALKRNDAQFNDLHQLEIDKAVADRYAGFGIKFKSLIPFLLTTFSKEFYCVLANMSATIVSTPNIPRVFRK